MRFKFNQPAYINGTYYRAGDDVPQNVQPPRGSIPLDDEAKAHVAAQTKGADKPAEPAKDDHTQPVKAKGGKN